MYSDQKAARIFGALFLLTVVTSIAGTGATATATTG